MEKTIKELEKQQLSNTLNENIKKADKTLKNYRNFLKLASLSDRPFSRRGAELAEEIDRSIQAVTEPAKAVLVNQYQTKPKDRQSRQQFCRNHQISPKDYEAIKRQGLLKFAQVYRSGALMEEGEQDGSR